MHATPHFQSVTEAILLGFKGLIGFVSGWVGNPVFGSKPLTLHIGALLPLYASLSATLPRKFYIVKERDMPTIPPYKLARLVNADKPITNDTNDRWYVVFYIWHKEKQCVVKKRDYRVNQYKTKAGRHDFAKRLIKELNQKLAEGYMLSDLKVPKADACVNATIDSKKDYTLEQAFKLVLPLLKASKRIATYNSYKSASDLFLEYCRQRNWHIFNVKSICQSDILNWLNHVKTVSGNSNTTRNNNVNQLRPVFTAMIENKMITENPAAGIPLLDEEDPTRVAFSPDQVKALKEAIASTDPRLWLFIQFMFYGFIRPKEIGLLRVKYIDLVNRSVYIPGAISKNRKSAYIRISTAFAEHIKTMDLGSYNPDDYVFGKNLITGSYLLPRSSVYKRFKKILIQLNFGDGYDLYSWKHTGAVFHYRARVDVISLKEQLRHASLDETYKYLRSLGLIISADLEDKSPVI